MIEYKVSVIIPMYNVEKYIDDCLMSLERQTLKDIEVIIIDDGSTDKSGDIAKKYVDNHSNYTLIKQTNKGQGTARNRGIDIATGKYLYFLDSDDYIADSTLQELYFLMEKHCLDVILFNSSDFYEVHDIQNQPVVYDEEWYGEIMSGDELLRRESGKGKYEPSNCFLMSRRDVLVDNNIKYEEGILHEDTLLFFMLMKAATQIMVVKDRYYYRRIRPNSTMTGDRYGKRFVSSVFVAEQLSLIDSTDEPLSFFIKAILGTAVNVYTKGRLYDNKSNDVKNAYKSFRTIAHRYRWWRSLYFILFCLCDRVSIVYRNVDV